MIVVPFEFISSKSSIIFSDFCGSRFPVGSSARIISGWFNCALAIAALCCSPPDSSYGFFSLGTILGLISLWLIIFTNAINKPKLATTLQEITIINEKTLEVGLFMLAIGTFLGGVWANESWGRYWGWDPKETWALVSILIYSFILHMRFIPPLKGVLTRL